MALTDITKGMSNAAEAINENFKAGSVVESATNENGRYIKFGDGTMICTRGITLNQTANQTSGSLYRTPTSVDYQFAAPFVGVPYVSGNSNVALICFMVMGAVSDKWTAVRAYSPVNNQTVIDVTLFAIGRWK